MFGIGEFYSGMHEAYRRGNEIAEEKERAYRQLLLEAGITPYEAETLVLKRREVEALEARASAESRHADAAMTESRKVGWFCGR